MLLQPSLLASSRAFLCTVHWHHRHSLLQLPLAVTDIHSELSEARPFLLLVGLMLDKASGNGCNNPANDWTRNPFVSSFWVQRLSQRRLTLAKDRDCRAASAEENGPSGSMALQHPPSPPPPCPSPLIRWRIKQLALNQEDLLCSWVRGTGGKGNVSN